MRAVLYEPTVGDRILFCRPASGLTATGVVTAVGPRGFSIREDRSDGAHIRHLRPLGDTEEYVTVLDRPEVAAS